MSSSSDPTPLEPRELLRVLARRKLLLLLPWGIAITLGVLAAVLLPPVYMSNVTMLLERPQALNGALGGVVNPLDPERQADLMRDQVQSSVFLRGVVTSTGLRSDPATRLWALKYASQYPGATDDDRIEEFLVARLRDAINIKRAKGGNTFQIIVEDRRPARAQRYAEAVANQFVLASKAAQLEAVRATQEFSTEQQTIYKRKLEESEARLEALKRSTLTSSLSSGAVSDANLPRARTLLDQADLDVQEQRQRLSSIQQQIGDRIHPYDPAKLSSGETTAMAPSSRASSGRSPRRCCWVARTATTAPRRARRAPAG